MSGEKYLLAPLWFGRRKSSDFYYLIDRIKSKIPGWESILLSRAGRTCFIKSMSNVMASYAMSCFRIPKGILARIDSSQ